MRREGFSRKVWRDTRHRGPSRPGFGGEAWGLLAAQIVVLMLGDCWENFVASPACQLCICFEYSTILGYLGSCYVLFGSSSTERYRGFVDGPMVPTSNVSNVLRKWPQELVAICGSVGSGRLGGK